MATTTVGRVLLKFFTPPEYHNMVDNEILDQKGISKLFADLSEKSPEGYSKIVSDLTRLGFEISTRQGTSITLKDLVSPIDKDKFWAKFEQEQDKIEASSDLPSVKKKKIFDNYNKAMSTLETDLLSSGLKDNKSLAKIVLAGSRGSPAQYRGTIATQGIVVDAEGNPKMDMPIKSSYAEGLSLPEFLVSSFGARTGEVLKKISVAQGGYGSKQFARALMPLQIVEYDCETQNGVDISVDDKESVGAYLAKAVKGYNRNNEVTLKMLNDLKNKGVKSIVIRSPMTCQSNKNNHSGGLCQLCVGRREKGLAALDSYIGLVAGTAVAEPLTESAMKARHCLMFDTKVFTQNGEVVALENIRAGDKILGADTNGFITPTVVLDVIDQGTQDVYRHTFRYGVTRETFTIDATNDHEVLALLKNCHKKLEEQQPKLHKLGEKHNLYNLVLPVAFDDSGCTNEPYAFVLGLLLGDGSYTTDAVQYYNFDSTSIIAIQEKLKPIGLRLHQSPTRKNQYRVVKTTSLFNGDNTPNPIKIKLKELGMFGKKAPEKTIPEAVWSWDNASVAELLAGLFFTDGSANLDHDRSKSEKAFRSYSFTSSSKQLVVQVKQLLQLRFGIYTSAVSTRKKENKKSSFISGRQIKSNHDLHMLRIRRPEAVCKFEHVVKLLGEKGGRFDKSIQRKAATDYYLCRRIKVEYLGKQRCFDLTVAHPDNLFVLANGAIVHNSGGAATSIGGNAGFKLINQLANVPKHFIGRAPLAQEDGVVTKVEEAAAGGYFITVNDVEHYIGLDQEPKVKVGDRVEEGDVLSTGLIDPRDVVKHRGIGEGRRYYMEAMKKAFDDSKLPVNRRNFELIAKAAIDHVQITDPEGIGDYLPDQIVSYSAIEKDYKPRKDSKLLRIDLAYGKYLEKPEMHYTIGTKVTSAVISKLKENDIESVLVNDNPPNFEPAMVRLLDVPEFNDDWFHVLNSTNLAKRFVNMVNRGAVGDVAGPSPIGGLAYGVGFGLKPDSVNYEHVDKK